MLVQMPSELTSTFEELHSYASASWIQNREGSNAYNLFEPIQRLLLSFKAIPMLGILGSTCRSPWLARPDKIKPLKMLSNIAALLYFCS